MAKSFSSNAAVIYSITCIVTGRVADGNATHHHGWIAERVA
jgi:hypothetical protein